MGSLFGFIFTKLFEIFGLTSKIGRLFFGGIFLSLLFVVLFNVACDLINSLMSWAVSSLNNVDVTNFESISAVNVDGVVAFIAIKLRIPECLSLILSAYPVRIILKAIPFVRLN